MMTELEWKGHKIQIDCRLAARYFWAATETVILVDGVEIARNGGFRLTENTTGKIIEDNLSRQISLVVKVDAFTFATAPYKLFIDEILIAQGRLRINNRIWSIVPIVVIPLFMCVLSMLILSLIS